MQCLLATTLLIISNTRSSAIAERPRWPQMILYKQHDGKQDSWRFTAAWQNDTAIKMAVCSAKSSVCWQLLYSSFQIKLICIQSEDRYSVSKCQIDKIFINKCCWECETEHTLPAPLPAAGCWLSLDMNRSWLKQSNTFRYQTKCVTFITSQ